ncbi:Metallo-beta-lactamase family protein [Sulfitobacter noctilucicola]|uniref:Glyoxylase-like metal-dependent hydrolase (Beta-lactamase superfamily II) n=1 Tax=Sulfitobacter noctilucicola TaxID=1342301 RepID=A0A7W6M7M9_9RHOB|nr:MBL fold metallo-hydrolase [Sulfitobacter noctilucicola]KIN64922.1 Metallo-beta-lactamase family protein [Sulfitobacter noctilucicola]MBB4173936.1 glyoxylase-like metal-dependent hydrolase (beta-lactamase superfamily II) [Sulfitobacter noctilucicola]
MTPPDDFDPPVGTPETLEPGLRRIVAPNPSPMTYRGTNTYLLGTRALAVIDPGPQNDAHLSAILAAVGPDQHISHVIVTHTHVDHSPLAGSLARACGAPLLSFGDATAGRSEVMQELAQSGMMGGGEGIDIHFTPDLTVADGELIEGDSWQLEALHTPGHIGNHLCLAWGDACFTADHVMGWASSLVSPPDGDLTDFMSSCARLSARDWRVFYPGHGAQIDKPSDRLEWLVTHRLRREAEIISALKSGPTTAQTLAQAIYTQTPTALLGAATRNVLAHLIDLTGKSIVTPTETLHEDVEFRLIQPD